MGERPAAPDDKPEIDYLESPQPRQAPQLPYAVQSLVIGPDSCQPPVSRRDMCAPDPHQKPVERIPGERKVPVRDGDHKMATGPDHTRQLPDATS
jgi:hypothetical protein